MQYTDGPPTVATTLTATPAMTDAATNGAILGENTTGTGPDPTSVASMVETSAMSSGVSST